MQYEPPLSTSWQDIPIIGPWAGKAGRIQLIVSNPCNSDPYIMVQGFFAALPMLIWTVAGPDCIDLKSGDVGGGHGKRRRKGRLKGGHHSFGIPTRPGWGYRLFRLASIAQGGAFWFTVVDATLDFILNWSTFMNYYGGCTKPNTGYGHLGIEGESFQFGEGIWFPLNFNKASSHIFVAGGNSIVYPKGFKVSPSFSINAKRVPPWPEPSNVETCLRHNPSGLSVLCANADKNDPGTGYSAVANGGFNPLFSSGGGFSAYYRSNAPFDAEGSTFDLDGESTPGMEPDPCGANPNPFA